MASYEDSVFVNCPFDSDYKSIFDAVVFAIHDCGYVARCALEIDDSGVTRIHKIQEIIANCKFGIHDICRVELDAASHLPRFNMPLELGIFLGAKRYGNKRQKSKSIKILDIDKYRFQKFCSDISGQDISAHNGDPDEAIKVVRNWLHKTLQNVTIPSGSTLVERYKTFTANLPMLCESLNLTVSELTFLDFQNLAVEWILNNPW
jgi:hypothetical protein